MPAIARVEPITTTRALRGPFDYRLPADMPGVGVGSMLEVPFAGRRLLGVVVGVGEESQVAPDRLAAPIASLEVGVPGDLVALAEWMGAEYCSTTARALGLVLPPGAGVARRPRVGAATALVAEPTPAGARALAGDQRLTPGQRAVLELLRDAAGPVPAAEAGLDHGGLRRLERRGLLALRRAPRRRRPALARLGSAPARPPRLTPAQRTALARVETALDEDDPPRLLLHGVTGSGKTEVYLHAAESALARGRGAIVLVPEIALTPQTVARFSARFGDTVAVLHSAMAQGERYDEWVRLRRGEARICVGPRSAVFAPIAGLGLVILDEEHDGSYKHEGDPRYDARRVAERRAAQAGAVLLAGSATPRPEAMHRYERLRLPARVDDRALPPVDLLDMRGARAPLHPLATEALAGVRRERGKAIVLLNRRGWSNFLSCGSCGRVWECPDCDVALVLHRAAGQVACHHCGHRAPAPGTCPDCRSQAVARHGAGTERLEHELVEGLGRPDFPVFRLDSDVVAGKDRVAQLLAAFDAAPAGVLLGTQMVAKGHDFPDVTLGVVLDADATLRFPDFRAEERTFALVAQLAGRVGRGPRGGRVLVQTLAPGAASLRLAARHDADAFLNAELRRREVLRYPPFADLIRVVCASAEPDAPHAAATAVRGRLEDSLPAATSVLGPAPLFRLRGRHRSQLVVKAADRAAAVRAVGAAVQESARGRAHRNVAFSVDVDPQ